MTQDEMNKEIEFLKDVTKRQLAVIEALNDIVGGEMHGGTTSNILNYSRWERRLIKAVEEERAACLKIAESMSLTSENMNKTWRTGCRDVAEAIRSRGEA